MGSGPAEQYQWISNVTASGFVETQNWVALLFHQHGQANVLDVAALEQVFVAVDVARSVPHYAVACAEGQLLQPRPEACSIAGVTNFWHDNSTEFHRVGESPEQVLKDLSQPRMPNGMPVLEKLLFGYPERDNVTHYFTSAQSLAVVLYMPNSNTTNGEEPASVTWEWEAVEALKVLQQEWASDPTHPVQLELHSKHSFGAEFLRAVEEDILLVPLIFCAMSLFTAFVFARRNGVASRGTLGMGAVVAVFLSICSGFGLLFILNVPLTSVTQISPFIMYVLKDRQ